MAFHDLVLSLDGRGGWEIHRGQRARRNSASQTGAIVESYTSSSNACMIVNTPNRQVVLTVLKARC
jgi:hypothetical protein